MSFSSAGPENSSLNAATLENRLQANAPFIIGRNETAESGGRPNHPSVRDLPRPQIGFVSQIATRSPQTCTILHNGPSPDLQSPQIGFVSQNPLDPRQLAAVCTILHNRHSLPALSLLARKAAFLPVIALLLLLAPMLNAEMLRMEASVEAMGSAYSIVAYDEDRYALQAAVDASFDEVRRLDHLLSNYKPASELSKINQQAADHPVRVSEEVFNLLAACLEYSRLSEGAFDITVGDLMKVWGFYKGSGHLPKAGEVQEALKTVGWRKVRLDPERRTVFFTQKGVELDPGGIGKGYAVDRMVAILKEKGIHSALITAGGSSIYALGAPPAEQGWTIDIKNPFDESKSEAEVVLKDQSMSTSGSYEKFFTADGKIYSHIMDPRTGFPAQGMISVSVITSRTIDSEAWTKPFFINGRQWASRHQPPGVRVFLCEDKKEHTCAWLQ